MRRLTNGNDRAYGILGLAEYLLTCEAFENPFQRRYLAGPWEPSLVLGLLWFVNIGTTTRLGDYRGPSWSWVPVDGGIDNESLLATSNTGLEIERVNAVPAASLATNDEPLQLVARLETDSYIKVRGKIRTLAWRSDEEYYYYPDKENLDFRNFPDLESNATLGLIPLASTQNVSPRCFPIFVDEAEECVGWLVPDTTNYLNSQEPLHCLQIAVEPETQAERQGFRKVWITRGIAMRPISRDGIDGTVEMIPSFERVGFFELEKKSTGVYLPMDAYGPADLRSYVLRAQPEVDPHDVFRGCEPQLIRIY